ARVAAAPPPILEQKKSLPSDRWLMTSPKLICAGVGLKPYLSSGISSAAATRFLACRPVASRKASATGVAWAAAVVVRQRVANAARRSGVLMVANPRGDELGGRWKIVSR